MGEQSQLKSVEANLVNLPAARRTSRSVSIAHRFPGPGAYFSTAESIPDEQDDLNSASVKIK